MPGRTYKPTRWGKRSAAYTGRAKAARAQRASRSRTAVEPGARPYRKGKERARIERTILDLHEPKFMIDAQYTNAECANDLVLARIDMPAQGDSISDRDGDKIFVDWIKIRGVLTKQADDGTSHVRIVVFRWFMDDAVSVPVIGDVLDTAGWGAALAEIAPYSQQLSKDERFQVLADKTVRLDQQPGASVLTIRNFKLHIRLNAVFNFNAAAITGNGNVYMMAVTNQAAAARVGPLITCKSTTRFRDM